MIKLIVSLGNPDIQYKHTRHNIAWQFIECLPFHHELNWKNKFKGQYSFISLHSKKLYLLKPLTYMNLSGESVILTMDFFKIQPEELLIIHDELELPFGFISLKNGGGLGGHNGLRSIESSIGTRDFKRMRLGISKPFHGNITPYVLGGFSIEEKISLPSFLEKSAGILLKAVESEDFNNMTKKYRKYNTIPNIK